MSRLFQKVTLAGEGAECGPKILWGYSSLLFLMEQCDLALLSQVPCHLDKMRDYDLLPGGLDHQNPVHGTQSKLESSVSLSSLCLL